MNLVKKTVKIGKGKRNKVVIGGKNPVSIQSMCNTKTEDWKTTTEQILKLQEEKCEMVRVAVPNNKAAKSLAKIKKHINIPLIADIHFDHKLAVESIKAGADKIRINPGNIGSFEKVKEVIDSAKKADIPIRIGINAGSLERNVLDKFGGPSAEALVESASGYCEFFEKNGFENIVLSLKTSDVKQTIKAYRMIAKKTPYPLHLGVTEAGTVRTGTVKNAIGIGILLLEEIGNTIRVSLSGDPVEEVKVAKDILKSLNLYDREPLIIACPTCGRTEIDVESIAKKVEKEVKNVPKGLHIAIMGCAVNGPGEAKAADYAITGGKEQGAIYKKGRYLKTIKEENLAGELVKIIKHDQR